MSIVRKKISWQLGEFLFVILGVIIGTGFFVIYTTYKAYGADDPSDSVNWWDTAVAEIDTHGFKDVFEEAAISAMTNTTSLYRIVSSKIRLQPQNDVIKVMAENHSMTKDEVIGVLNGDVNTLQQFAPVSGVKKTVGDLDEAQTKYVMAVSDQFKQEYKDLYEQYKIQMDVDISISPSEMFMNGDILDSGFDLVQDLSVIEYILFEKNTESSVGAPYSGASSSPVPGGGGGGNNGGGGSGDGGDTGDDSGDKPNPDNNGDSPPKGIPQVNKNGNNATISLGNGDSVDAEVLPGDNCSTGSTVGSALDDFNNENGGNDNGNPDDGNPDDGNPNDGNPNDGNPNGNPNDSGNNDGGGAESTPPPSGNWGSVFCPSLGLNPPEEPQEGASNMPGLGGSSGEPFNAEGPPFTFSVSICFTLEMIMGKVSAGNSTTCIQCEIEQMLAALDEAASDALIPNKVTGNPFEPAKCKKALIPNIQNFLEGSIKIILVTAPIQTPPNDDLPLELNMFKSWNQFSNQTAVGLNGISIPYTDPNGNIKFINARIPKAGESLTKNPDLEASIPDNTQADLILAEEAEMLKNQNNTAKEMQANAQIEMAKLPLTYAEPVLTELALMRTTFASYSLTFAEILNKPCDKEIE